MIKSVFSFRLEPTGRGTLDGLAASAGNGWRGAFVLVVAGKILLLLERVGFFPLTTQSFLLMPRSCTGRVVPLLLQK